MNRLPLFLNTALMVLALIATGCEPAESPDMAPPATETEAETFTFDGDFAGPLGLQLWSVRDSMEADVPGTLSRVYDMGFREVELAGTYGMSAEDFKAMLDSIGLVATAMHAPYDQLESDPTSVLDDAETLGVDYVGVAWIPHPENQPFTPEMARTAAANFNAWGEATAERGLKFFYHNHGYEFEPAADGTIPMDVLMEETNPESVAFEMDVFWTFHPGVDPAEWLRKYPDRWELMHIKDMAQGTPVNDYSGGAPAEAKVPVGQGQIDYSEVLEAAEEIGIERYYIEDESTDPINNIPISVDYMEVVTFPEDNA